MHSQIIIIQRVDQATVQTVVLKLRNSRNLRIWFGKMVIILSLKKYEEVLIKGNLTLLQVCVSLVPLRFPGRFIAI